MLKKANPSPKNAILDYEGFTLEFKCYLQSNAFSYRCENYRSLGCSYLLTVLIKENYHPETWICFNLIGAFGHQLQITQNSNKKKNLKALIQLMKLKSNHLY